jgi:hypothetical protein
MLNTQYRLSLLYPPTPTPTLTLPHVQRYHAPNEAQSRQPPAMRHNDKTREGRATFLVDQTQKKRENTDLLAIPREHHQKQSFCFCFKLMSFFYHFFLTFWTLRRIFFYNVPKSLSFLDFLLVFILTSYSFALTAFFIDKNQVILKLMFLYKNQVISTLHSCLSPPNTVRYGLPMKNP